MNLVKADNALAAFGGFDTLASQLEESAQDARSNAEQLQDGSVLYAKFRKGGEEGDISPWEYGQDNLEIYPESVWVLDPTTYQRGYKGWQGSYGGGSPQPGQSPDEILTPWNEAWPARDPDRPWISNPAFKFRAMCIESPREEDVGAMVEFSVHQKMQEGFKDIEFALRERVAQAARAKKAGQDEQFAQLMSEIYPTVRFDAKTKVKTKKYGSHNKPILIHVGWTGQVQDLDAVPVDDEPEAELAAEVVKTRRRKTTARRRRSQED